MRYWWQLLCVSIQKVNRDIMERVCTNRGVTVIRERSHHLRHTLTGRPGGDMCACLSAAGPWRPGKGSHAAKWGKMFKVNRIHCAGELCCRRGLCRKYSRRCGECPGVTGSPLRVRSHGEGAPRLTGCQRQRSQA